MSDTELCWSEELVLIFKRKGEIIEMFLVSYSNTQLNRTMLSYVYSNVATPSVLNRRAIPDLHGSNVDT